MEGEEKGLTPEEKAAAIREIDRELAELDNKTPDSIGVMSRQALGKPLADLESFKQQVRAWTIKRNKERVKINWQFKTRDARIKLAKLYPVMV